MKKFEIFTRKNRDTGTKKSTGIKIDAESRKAACDLYCRSNNGIWVSAKEVK